MGMPAARITDMHTCPMVTVLVPHVGGPIVKGMVTVITGCMPQARILDTAVCVGPIDVVSQGEGTVLTGGLPTSRIFHMTAHGGVIVTGWPTVLIGSACPPGSSGTVTFKVAPGSSPAFVSALQNALAQILPTRSGAEFLRQMGANGHAITFQEMTAPNGECRADNGAAKSTPPGTSSTISWNPNHHTTDKTPGVAHGTPGAAIILAHEMVHALHNANGDNRNGPNDNYPPQTNRSARNEERSTVGTSGPIRLPDGTIDPTAPDYSNDMPTENSFRDDLGVPRRPSYYPENWPGRAPW